MLPLRQTADAPDMTNFIGERRYFRGSLLTLKAAVEWWNAESKGLSFIAHLGDLVDMRVAKKGATFATELLHRVLDVLSASKLPTLFAIGNHDYYAFTREELDGYFKAMPLGSMTERPTSYHSFSPAPGQRIVVLDSFHEAVISWPEGDPRHQRAWELLDQHNPNPLRKPGPWFAGLDGVDKRWVPFNGALGKEQRDWLSATMKQAEAAGEVVIVLSHVVLHPRACDGANVIWDFEETLSVLRESTAVVAVLAGHDHNGGYHRDARGIHHITLQSPLNKGTNGKAFGIMRVFADHLELVGPALGDLVARTPPWKSPGGRSRDRRPSYPAALSLPAISSIESELESMRFEFSAELARCALRNQQRLDHMDRHGRALLQFENSKAGEHGQDSLRGVGVSMGTVSRRKEWRQEWRQEWQQKWQQEWQRRFNCWLTGLPLTIQAQLDGCMGAFGVHLASRLDAAWRAAQLQLSFVQHPPPPRNAQKMVAAEDNCKWLTREALGTLELPKFPAFDGAFGVDQLLLPPIPRLLPQWEQLLSHTQPDWVGFGGGLDQHLEPSSHASLPGHRPQVGEIPEATRKVDAAMPVVFCSLDGCTSSPFAVAKLDSPLAQLATASSALRAASERTRRTRRLVVGVCGGGVVIVLGLLLSQQLLGRSRRERRWPRGRLDMRRRITVSKR